MAVLQVLNGLNPGQQFPLDREKSVMGRSPDCDIVLDVGAVSRQHAQISAASKDYFVEDLKSRNGTFVNGELIHGRPQLQRRRPAQDLRPAVRLPPARAAQASSRDPTPDGASRRRDRRRLGDGHQLDDHVEAGRDLQRLRPARDGQSRSSSCGR